jgi:hypothetical protein
MAKRWSETEPLDGEPENSQTTVRLSKSETGVAPPDVVRLMRQIAEDWEAEARLWDDTRVAGLENLNGSNRSAKEIAAACLANAEKILEAIADHKGEFSSG